MSKKLTILSLTIILTGILILPILTSVQAAQYQTCPRNDDGTPKTLKQCQEWALGKVGTESGYGPAGAQQSENISFKIGQLISYVLAFLGVVFLVIVVYSGIQWMTAGGNEETIKKARTRLVNATVGLAIVMGAYAITWLVVSKLQTSVLPPAEAPAALAKCNEFNNYSSECIQQGGACQYILADNICQPMPGTCVSRLPGDCTSSPINPIQQCPPSDRHCALKSDSSGCECVED